MNDEVFVIKQRAIVCVRVCMCVCVYVCFNLNIISMGYVNGFKNTYVPIFSLSQMIDMFFFN